jgi:hypothetical protein
VALIGAFTWENAARVLYMEEEPGCPHATPQRLINEPNVYRRYIQL